MNSELKKSILNQIHIWLNVNVEIQNCLLYGSFGTDTFNEKSDVDIAIQLKHKLSHDERINYSQSLSQLLKRSVDLVDLSSAHGLILKEILKANQVILLKNSSLYAELLKRFWFEEADFTPIREKILKERRQRVFKS